MTKKEALDKAVGLKLLVDKLDGIPSNTENWREVFDAYPLESKVSDFGLLNMIRKFEDRINHYKNILGTVNSEIPKDIQVYFFDYIEPMAAIYSRKYVCDEVAAELAVKYPDYGHRNGIIFITRQRYEEIFAQTLNAVYGKE